MRSNKVRETTPACIARCKADKWKSAIKAVGEEKENEGDGTVMISSIVITRRECTHAAEAVKRKMKAFHTSRN